MSIDSLESLDSLRRILSKRLSIRKWKAEAIPRPVIEEAIALATLALSGNNQQN